MAIRAVAVSLALGVASAPAAAEPRIAAGDAALGLAWDAPAGCPDGAAIRARIEQRLGRSLDDVVLGISVDVRASGGRFVARIDLGAVTVANDVRTLTSARCGELADAVAVIVARVAREAADARKTHDPAAARAADARVAARDAEDVHDEVQATVAAPAPRRWSIGARASMISGIGVVPEVGTGGEIAGYVRRDSAMFELAQAKWLASSQKIRYGEPARIDVGFGVTAVRIGWRPPRLPLRAWGDVEVGEMSGEGVALSNVSGSGHWVAVGSGFGVGWPIASWIRLVGTTEIDLAFERVRFTLGDGLVIYQPAPASARATVGFELGWQ